MNWVSYQDSMEVAELGKWTEEVRGFLLDARRALVMVTEDTFTVSLSDGVHSGISLDLNEADLNDPQKVARFIDDWVTTHYRSLAEMEAMPELFRAYDRSFERC